MKNGLNHNLFSLEKLFNMAVFLGDHRKGVQFEDIHLLSKRSYVSSRFKDSQD